MGLAGELRNRIYYLALAEPQTTIINSLKHTQPGLLQTCKQIRNEASSIYYGENCFALEIWDLKFTAQMEHEFREWIRQRGNKNTGNFGYFSRQNFKAWLKLAYQREAKSFRLTSSKFPAYDCTSVAFELDRACYRAGVTWEATAEVLEVFKERLAERWIRYPFQAPHPSDAWY